MNKKIFALAAMVFSVGVLAADNHYVFKAGDPSLKDFVLGPVPYPDDNPPNADRENLGRTLFFDPRISGAGNVSCATCHNPGLGWSDGLPTAKGVKSTVLERKSPTLFNSAYSSIQMWDGRKKSLEDQATGPMEAELEMHTDMPKLLGFLNANEGYKTMFAKAYPGAPIDANSMTKAIATFERTIISNNSPFDRWVKGDAGALTPQQVHGFEVFAGKGNCTECHTGANFTNDGFHNIGLASFGNATPDLGRYAIRPGAKNKGAFKTPTLREVARRAYYFHDGTASSLMEVVEHYDRGGDVKSNLDKSIVPLHLTMDEKQALVSFMESLSSPYVAVMLPELPLK